MTGSAQTPSAHTAAGWVGYRDFGAVGDGRSDDLPAIAATHAYANEHNLSVRADDAATYYLGGGNVTAVIETSTDFGTARFLIDDTAVANREAAIFEVRSRHASFEVTGVATLRRDQPHLPVTLPAACLVRATDDRVRHFIRLGANQDAGAPQTDIFLVGPEGTVDPRCPISWDFDHLTTLTAFPVDSEELRLTGGVFVTIANRAESRYTYHRRGIAIRRSNVVVAGLRHEVTGEGPHGAPYTGFLDIADCAGVTVQDCWVSGHLTYETIGSAGVPVRMGSYDISVTEAVDVTFRNCLQTNDINDRSLWGVFGSNYCKNLVLDGCTLSRFDAHKGCRNVTIRNCVLGHMGINAIGEGVVLVEDTRSYGRTLVELRPDYGSTWHGEVIIRNCVFQPLAGRESRAVLIHGHNTGRHDFGHPCAMPERITIDNLVIDDAHHPADDPGPVVLADVNPERRDDTYVEEFPYELTREVVLRNVTTTSGRELRLSDNPTLFAGVRVTR